MNYANPGWYFYRHYYKDFFVNTNNMWLTKEEAKKVHGNKLKDFEGSQERYFNKLNSGFFKSVKDALSDNMRGADINEVLSFELETAYPGLLIGTGYNHETGTTGEFKLGFFFDYTTGLPVLPGSSVKGLLRSVFPGFTIDDVNDSFECNPKNDNKSDKSKVPLSFKKSIAGFTHWLLTGEEKNSEELSKKELLHLFEVENALFESVQLPSLKELINKKDAVMRYRHVYERDIFFDAVISRASHSNQEIMGVEHITPHLHPNNPAMDPYAEPTPLQLIKILPGVKLNFSFLLRNPDGESLGLDADARLALYKKILSTIGAGAKTNVGFGHFKSDDLQTFTHFENVPQSNTREEVKILPVFVNDLEKLKKGDSVRGVVKSNINRELVFELPDLKNLICNLQGYGNASAFPPGSEVILKITNVVRKGTAVTAVSVDRVFRMIS